MTTKKPNNVFDSFYQAVIPRFTDVSGKINFVSVICAERGWNPMNQGETIKISFGNEKYEIKRLK